MRITDTESVLCFRMLVAKYRWLVSEALPIQYISGITDKVNELSRQEGKVKVKDREAADLIFTKSHMGKKESNRALIKGGVYEPITKKWLDGLFDLHMGQPKG